MQPILKCRWWRRRQCCTWLSERCERWHAAKWRWWYLVAGTWPMLLAGVCSKIVRVLIILSRHCVLLIWWYDRGGRMVVQRMNERTRLQICKLLFAWCERVNGIAGVIMVNGIIAYIMRPLKCHLHARLVHIHGWKMLCCVTCSPEPMAMLSS